MPDAKDQPGSLKGHSAPEYLQGKLAKDYQSPPQGDVRQPFLGLLTLRQVYVLASHGTLNDCLVEGLKR